LLKQYEESYANPINQASFNPFMEVIEPRETRRVLIKTLELLATKKKPLKYSKRHGNIPL